MKKIGYLLFSFLPFIAVLSLQLIIIIPAMVLILAKTYFSHSQASENIDFDAIITEASTTLGNAEFSALLSIIIAVCTIFIFAFWYSHQFQIRLNQAPQNFINFKLILGLVLLVPGLQYLSGILTSVSASLFPGWMNYYETLMETAGLTGSPSPLMMLYAVFLGPIGEEFVFRGVTLTSVKRALPFWAANLFQALLFGVFHLNVIQGIYAFIIGLFLGYICEKGGSIYLSILLHILFNAWGTFQPTNLPIFSNPIFILCFMAVSFFFGIYGFRLFQKNIVYHKASDPMKTLDDMETPTYTEL